MDRLPELAADLVHLPAAMIVATNTAAAIAAKAATTTIPIVFVLGADPVELRLVDSFNRPGANVTGMAFLINKLVGKRLELLSELVPGTNALAMLADANNPNAEADVRDAQSGAAALGRPLLVAKPMSSSELDGCISRLVQDGAAGLLIGPHANFRVWRDQLLELAARHKLPASYPSNDFVTAGGLMSYAPDPLDVYRQAGFYTGRILSGEKPADLPVMQPTKFEFAINMRTAKALGLDVPPTLLARADEVIE